MHPTAPNHDAPARAADPEPCAPDAPSHLPSSSVAGSGYPHTRQKVPAYNAGLPQALRESWNAFGGNGALDQRYPGTGVSVLCGRCS